MSHPSRHDAPRSGHRARPRDRRRLLRRPAAPLVALIAGLAVSPAVAAEPPAAPTAAPAAPVFLPPKLLTFVEAPAPPALAERGEAEVVLTIDVDEAGKVVKVEVAKAAGDGFDEAAREAALKFVFSPGTADGKPVHVRITYRYRFLYRPPAPPDSAPAQGVPDGAAPPPSPATVPATVPFGGRVLGKGERLPQAGVTVSVAGEAAITDGDGRFTFAALPVGPHTVELRGAGITPAKNPLVLTAGKRLDVTYYVLAKERFASTVRGQRVVEETVETTLSGEEVRRIPGTQGDTIKAVQNLPGVARAPFGGGLLVVWGSSPFDTRTYVDGVYIPTAFHFFGLRSTLSSELVQGVSFRPGGFGVEYGRGMGGVIEVETRKPRSDGIHGFAQLDLIDASALVEGRITKTLSFAAGLRRSTLDAWLPYLTPNDFQLTPTYWDYQAKLSWRPSSRDELDVFFFGSDDAIRLVSKQPDPNLSGNFDSHIFYHRILLRYAHRWGKISLTLTPSVGYDVPFQFSGTFGNTTFGVDARSCPYGLRAVLRAPVTPWLRIDAGVDFEGTRWGISGTSPVAGQPREGDPPGARGGGGFVSTSTELWTNHVAPFVAATFSLASGRVTLVPQLRLDVYSWTAYQGTPDAYSHAFVNLEPRLLARWKIRDWVALKAAFGVYRQPPDVSSLLRLFGNPELVPQLSLHYVLGLDFDPTSKLHLELVGFYKDLRQLPVRGQGVNDPTLVSDGLGRVYGGELLVRQELWKNFFGWISYTLSRSERRDHPGDAWRTFQYDQTHILTLVASYKLPRGYQVGLRFRYVTGNPTTPITGAYLNVNDGRYRPVYGPVYSSRNGDFHQLDLRFDKTWTFNRWKLAAYVDIQNLYYSKSPEGQSYNFDYTQSQPIAGLPIVPSLGLRGEF